MTGAYVRTAKQAAAGLDPARPRSVLAAHLGPAKLSRSLFALRSEVGRALARAHQKQPSANPGGRVDRTFDLVTLTYGYLPSGR